MSRRSAFALAIVPLWINLAVTGCDHSTGVPDFAPPAAIGDLGSYGVSSTTVVLRWTAPGNDGTLGTAAQYDVRHSLTPITDTSWDAATPVAAADVPSPAAAGTLQELTIAGLTPHQVHYFALRATDQAGNRAAISNSILAATEDWGRAQSEVELIGQFEMAYRTRDFDKFRLLFHPDYRFYLNQAQPDGTTSWGLTEELRIHRRMFRSQDSFPGEYPVPPDLWLVSIDITLNLRGPFQDARSYYFDPISNPDGFHREDFAVTQADYVASLFFQTQGETQYRVDGAVNFVVVNDLAKALGDEGKFLIYRWEDLGSGRSLTAEAKTWGSIKELYS